MLLYLVKIESDELIKVRSYVAFAASDHDAVYGEKVRFDLISYVNQVWPKDRETLLKELYYWELPLSDKERMEVAPGSRSSEPRYTVSLIGEGTPGESSIVCVDHYPG